MFSTFTGALAVAPSDTVAFSRSQALWIGGAGNVKVTMAGEGGAVVTFTAVPAGTLLPIAAKQVFATGTTATNILALR